MGIYITGIETPKGHNYVTITIWHSGTASYGLFDREGNLSDFKSIKVAHVPPHGRLIDADALKETLDYYIREAGWGDTANKALGWVKDEFIDSEPTVIPASEEET